MREPDFATDFLVRMFQKNIFLKKNHRECTKGQKKSLVIFMDCFFKKSENYAKT